MGTKIQWTDETWNPIIGCSKTSPGCDNCYAEKAAASPRLQQFKQYKDVISGKTWNHGTAFVESALTKPLHWRKPRKIFVCSMGDLFHESVPFEWIDKVFAVMALCPQHTFQVLTKRSARMLEYFQTRPPYNYKMPAQSISDNVFEIVNTARRMVEHGDDFELNNWPLLNVWLGVTCEDQQRADERIPDLLKCPAAKRFISCEPLLGETNLNGNDSSYDSFLHPRCPVCDCNSPAAAISSDKLSFCEGCDQTFEIGTETPPLDLVICGGESGANRRFCNSEWVLSIVKQCKEAGVACFVKQLHDQETGQLIKAPKGWPREMPEV